MSNKPYNILAERLESTDKDFRYMAASDLLNELQKGPIQLDPLLESKLCTALLKALQDTSSDVQSIALKALPLLLAQSELHLLETVIEILIANLLHISEDSKSNHQRNTVVAAAKNVSRDNCLITLKSLLNRIDPTSTGDTIIGQRVVPKLLSSARNNSSLEVKLDCLDMLCDVTTKFSFTIVRVADEFMESLSGLVSSSHNMVRKRAVHCLALFLSRAPYSYLQSFMDSLLFEFRQNLQAKQVNKQVVDTVRNSLSTIQALFKVTGSHVLYPYIGTIAELLLKLLDSPSWIEDEDLYESVLQIFELFLQTVPIQLETIQSQLATVLEAALRYDPNLVEQDTEFDEESGSELEEDDDFTDDEDLSCKVRRVAARCIHAIFLARNFHKLSFPLAQLADCMIQRLQERDEQVMLELLNGLTDLFKTIIPCLPSSEELNLESSIYHQVILVLKERSSFIILKLQLVYKSRSIPLKNAVLVFMKEFIAIAAVWLSEQDLMNISQSYVEPCFLKENNASVQSDGIALLERCAPLLCRHKCPQHLAVFLNHLVDIGAQGYYRITAQSLHACKSIFTVLTQDDLAIASISDALLKAHDFAMYRLEASDQDTEVKEAAIECLSTLCASFPELVSLKRDKSLRLMLDKLHDDFVRTTAIRSFSNILQSPLGTKIDEQVLMEFWKRVISLLRKKDDKLRESCLESINCSVTLVPSQLDSSLVSELTSLIHRSEWRRTAIVFQIFSKLIAWRDENFVLLFKEETYPAIMNVLVSSPLQGKLKGSISELFRTIIYRRSSYFPVANIFHDILALVKKDPKMHSSVMKNLSSLVAIFWSANIDMTFVCQTLLEILQSPLDDNSKSSKLFVLFTLNELGYMDSVTELALSDKMEGTIYEMIRCEDEEIVGSAAAALGSLIRFVDSRQGISKLVSYVNGTETRGRYVYLLAVKEAILCQIHLSSMSLLNDIDAMTQSLIACVQDADNALQPMETSNTEEKKSIEPYALSSSSKESIRSISSECLGTLLAVSPLRLFAIIQQSLTSSNVQVRWTSLLAVKAAFNYLARTDSSLDLFIQHLHPYLPYLLDLLQDPNADVDTAAISFIITCARLCPMLLKEKVSNILNVLLLHTEPRPDLIKTVDLGPFKHSIDEGIQLRKTAFEALLALLPSYLESFQNPPIPERLVNAVIKGLKDHPDVRGIVEKLLIYLLSNYDAFHILKDDSKISSLVAVLSDIVSSKPKENAVAQEIEKHKVSNNG
ncbi:hypothetical protein Gasu_19400 isoform 2 [Galdieria sulphuraria]|uniref:TATA-binding protein interacting (TIP20) domain-containing protein n=1 Tax=Galdieria sulphuraria TaxID=130081 RepID=M2Y4D0_GALSU|nr:hypothetical protein Gasu_19400 isoform 2 [Galdieria sulphuraria]EME30694.1 hypothetical protein isoform 2 [Galdieria sulphuraria]|eukprot:XP_005707214.1 hypothetical protein isoform 2 [Galdieria sulphuraria]